MLTPPAETAILPLSSPSQVTPAMAAKRCAAVCPVRLECLVWAGAQGSHLVGIGAALGERPQAGQEHPARLGRVACLDTGRPAPRLRHGPSSAPSGNCESSALIVHCDCEDKSGTCTRIRSSGGSSAVSYRQPPSQQDASWRSTQSRCHQTASDPASPLRRPLPCRRHFPGGHSMLLPGPRPWIPPGPHSVSQQQLIVSCVKWQPGRRRGRRPWAGSRPLALRRWSPTPSGPAGKVRRGGDVRHGRCVWLRPATMALSPVESMKVTSEKSMATRSARSRASRTAARKSRATARSTSPVGWTTAHRPCVSVLNMVSSNPLAANIGSDLAAQAPRAEIIPRHPDRFRADAFGSRPGPVGVGVAADVWSSVT